MNHELITVRFDWVLFEAVYNIRNTVMQYSVFYTVCVLGYDGGSSDSECDGPTMNEHEIHSPLMPDFWLIIQIQKDRLEVFSHSRFAKLTLHNTVARVRQYTVSEIKVTACTFPCFYSSTIKGEMFWTFTVYLLLEGTLKWS